MKVSINEITLTNIGDAIREKTGKTDLIAPGNMPEEIRGIVSGADPVIQQLDVKANGTYNVYDGIDGFGPVVVNVPQDGGPSQEDLTITGDCVRMFIYNKWNWVIDKYGSQIITKNLTDTSYMFQSSDKLTAINMTLNMSPTTNVAMLEMFKDCKKIETLPVVNNARPKNLGSLLSGCQSLRTIPSDYFDTWDFTYLDSSSSSTDVSRIFNSCYSLREVPMEILRHGSPNTTYGNTYSVFGYTFYYCYALNEVLNMPNPHYNAEFNKTTSSNRLFYSMLDRCTRLKNFTFAPMEPMKWANQTLDFSVYVGWSDGAGYPVNYNSGITSDKLVNSDEKYAALKNDPDWFTTFVDYSRYNHDSAVATINSLPDCSAYQASGGGSANIIKFKGAAGAKTDGGAINTLTDAEIAVAAAKGWTVTLA